MTESEAYFIAQSGLRDRSGAGETAAGAVRFAGPGAAVARGGSASVEGIGAELVEKLTSWKEMTDAEKERKWAEELGLHHRDPGGRGVSGQPDGNLRSAAVPLYKGQDSGDVAARHGGGGLARDEPLRPGDGEEARLPAGLCGRAGDFRAWRAASTRRRISARWRRRGRPGPCSAAGWTRCIRRRTTRSRRRSSSRAGA